jgi:hypothetical protein
MSLRAAERCCLTTASPDNPSKEIWSALIEDSHLFFSPNDFITEDKLWIEGISLKELVRQLLPGRQLASYFCQVSAHIY